MEMASGDDHNINVDNNFDVEVFSETNLEEKSDQPSKFAVMAGTESTTQKQNHTLFFVENMRNKNHTQNVTDGLTVADYNIFNNFHLPTMFVTLACVLIIYLLFVYIKKYWSKNCGKKEDTFDDIFTPGGRFDGRQIKSADKIGSFRTTVRK